MTDSERKLPEEPSPCDRIDCPGIATSDLRGWDFGYGLAGGGIGCYIYCQICQQVISKVQDKE